MIVLWTGDVFLLDLGAGCCPREGRQWGVFLIRLRFSGSGVGSLWDLGTSCVSEPQRGPTVRFLIIRPLGVCDILIWRRVGDLDNRLCPSPREG